MEFEDIGLRIWLSSKIQIKMDWLKHFNQLLKNNLYNFQKCYLQIGWKNSFQSTFTEMNKLPVLAQNLSTQNSRYLPSLWR